MDFMYVTYSWMAVSAAGLAGFWLYLHYRRRDRMLGQSAVVEQLEAQVQGLQAELDAVAGEMHDRLNQLHERVDFAERLLQQSAEPRRIRDTSSRVPTPV